MTVAAAPRRGYDLAGLRGALGGIATIDDPIQIKLKSRDFYWYSPILKSQLRDVTADVVVVPRDEAEVLRVARACAEHGVPLTVRGAGTGNYGQAMPLRGGVVLEMTGLDRIKWLKPGMVRVEAGKKLVDLETATLETGWELRCHPSTRRTATIGGFIAGGSGGVGSINYGMLRDRANVAGLRIVTLDRDPRTIELRGDDVQKAVHAYGTNGIITELEMPLAPAWPWAELVADFPDVIAAVRFGQALAESDGIVKKLIAPIDWRAAQLLKPLLADLAAGRAICLCMIAEPSVEPFRLLVGQHGGSLSFTRAPGVRGHVPPLYEFSWNHTTLHALKVDRKFTYLQTFFPPPDHIALIDRMVGHFGDEVVMHVEFARLAGAIVCFGLQIVRFTTRERLAEIIRFHEQNGCPIFDPHTYVLEDGGMKVIDAAQLAFKKEADPLGLMNPGKMRGWDGPTA